MGKARSKRCGREQSDTSSGTDEPGARIGTGIDNEDITAVTISRSKRKLAVSNPSVEVSARKSRDNQEEKEGRVKAKSAPAIIIPRSLPTPSSMSAARAIPLLICSIGNPGKHYANTLHSAGHMVMKKLHERLEFTHWQKSKPHGNGLVSYPAAPPGDNDSDWTLWQSTSLMNISGKGVRSAHDTWAKEKLVGEGEEGSAAAEGQLVILHDELEKPLGDVTLNVRQGASAKGHNGLKSILLSMRDRPFVRIGIGIGRPLSRDRNDVADYVMRKVKPEEHVKIEGCVQLVVAKLRELERTTT